MKELDNKLKPLLEELDEKAIILQWLIKGYGLTGILLAGVKVLTKEWIVKNYNMEMNYFKKLNL